MCVIFIVAVVPLKFSDIVQRMTVNSNGLGPMGMWHVACGADHGVAIVFI